MGRRHKHYRWGQAYCKLESVLDEITVIAPEQFEKVCRFLFIMANQLSELAYKNILQKRSNREKEELQDKLSHKFKMVAGGIAYDFNKMLGGILGTSLLQPEKQPEIHPRKYP